MKSKNSYLAALQAVLLLLVLVSSARCQSTVSTISPTLLTTLPAGTISPTGTTSSTTPTASTTPSTPPIGTTGTTGTTTLSQEAIVGIAAAGGVLVVAAVVFIIVCLCCCCVRKRRKAGRFVPVNDKTGAQLTDTLMYQPSAIQETNGIHKPSDQNKGGEHEFEMQVNIADESMMIPSTSYTQESVETNLRTTPAIAVSNPRTLSASEKGYIKMSPAGSIRSHNDQSAETTEAIYSNADTTTISPVPRKSPSTSPKPIRAARSIEKLVQSQEAVEPPAPKNPPVPDEPQEDLYVETDVFVEDRHLQDSDYYNKDTIETIRQGRSLDNVVDPVQTHTVYANVPSTPGHTVKSPKSEDRDDSYQNVEQFLVGKASASASPQPESTEYYNYKPAAARDSTIDDYNYVEVTKPDTENPYSLEDDQYVYMKSQSGSSPSHLQATSNSTEVNRKKYQNLMYPGEATPTVDPKDHKYKNLNYVDDRIATASAKPDSKKPGRQIMAELHFPPKAAESAPTGSASKSRTDTPYMNLLDSGQEEVYEELPE